MSDKSPQPQLTADTLLMKGCLGGVGLAVTFLLISGLTYLLASRLQLPRNTVLAISIASGPLLGSALLVAAYTLAAGHR